MDNDSNLQSRDLQSDLQQEDLVDEAEGHDPKKTAGMKAALRRYVLARAGAREVGRTENEIGEILPIAETGPI
ncbi:MAG: hypothetical protein ACYC8W_05535 [Candidatus Tyrphobacter sp.]